MRAAMSRYRKIVIDLIFYEADRADSKYGPFTSSHEGLGVLAEEYTELIEAIRSNDVDRIQAEAIQVSAVALRLAEAMTNESTLKRSGCK